MSQIDVDILKRTLERERAARKQAEKILESKATELYQLTQELKISNDKLEKLVKEKTSQLQGVFENIVDAYVVMDLRGHVMKMNVAAINLLGFDCEKEDLNLMALVDPSEKENVSVRYKMLMSNGSITNFVLKINTRNQGLRMVHINASLIFDDNKNPIAAQGIVRDITNEHAAEEAIKQSERRLSTLITNLDSGVLLEDENRHIVLTNSKFCELFSVPISPEQMVGADCEGAADQSKALFENPEEFVSRVNKLVKDRKEVLGDELRMVNGTILERDYIPIFKNDNYKGHLWSYRDVTLRRKYRKSLEVQKQKYSSIIANMNLGLVEVDTEDRILMVNQSFCEMSGYHADELVGKKGAELLLDKKYSEKINNENRKRLKGISNSYEVEIETKQGESRHWLISGAPNYNLKGEVIGSIGIHLDITDVINLQKQKETLLIQLEKNNQELQDYAHIVSHDLKSPLRSIYALTNWIKQDNKGKLDDVTVTNLTLIESTLEKMEQLIEDIYNYSSAGAESNLPEDVDLNELVNNLISMLYVPEHVSISIKKSLPSLKAYKTKIQQVFQNLLTNAIKFIDKEKGQIEIDVENKNTYFLFSIKDNGIGIEDKNFNKIFKLFSKLGDQKDSTGIGLSIVKKIVELHHGEVWLESKLNEGTTFYFTIKKDL